MSRHRQHYQPARAEEPSALAIIAGAATTLLTLWVCTVFLFSL